MSLDEVLHSLSVKGPLPSVLPVSHLADRNVLSRFADTSLLSPKPCTVFEEELVYLFYGGVFYPGKARVTSNATFIPVAFVFRPGVLTQLDRFYPFDTGSVAKKKCGKYWCEQFGEFRERFGVKVNGDHTTPAKLVHHFFGTNDAYLSGSARSECDWLYEACPMLHRFLRGDKIRTKPDDRYNKIEGQSTKTLAARDLLWIGYPDLLELDVARLLDHLAPDRPQLYRYKFIERRPPEAYAVLLRDAAHKEVIERFVNRP